MDENKLKTYFSILIFWKDIKKIKTVENHKIDSRMTEMHWKKKYFKKFGKYFGKVFKIQVMTTFIIIFLFLNINDKIFLGK